jgi:type I restriction enzyme M protein
VSEELLQTTPHQLVRYLYYKLGASTLSQLKKEKIINVKVPLELAAKKPDGLIVVPNGTTKAYIEYKQPSEFVTKKQRQVAILQEIEAAKVLCKLLIVSDGDKSCWINTLTGEEITEKDGKPLKVFSAKRILEGKLTEEEITELEDLLDRIDHSLSTTNNAIFAPSLLDPSPLARAIWQKIWINTGKEPEKCLYNVVELFVFKFLSDIGVLKAHNNFNSVYSLIVSVSDQDALKHYAQICRKEIRDLFPTGADGTTIINGTIFVNEKGEPNLSQARLFAEILKNLQAYSDEYGSFKYIQREFKTRLYESFLRQSAGVRFLGQYLTPRNVVLAMVAMSTANSLTSGARICDPFCGVGGFILETIVGNPQIYEEYVPRNGVVAPRITLVGFDKGTDEKDDERTIILAKANMLIYFSDLLVKYNSPKLLKAFADGAFNKAFTLIRSNLGTFGRWEEDPFDLILTNPPYVTSGSMTCPHC